MLQLLRRSACFAAVALLCLGLGENYPFSNFPMYSSFAKSSYLLYLADASANPLPCASFGLTSSAMKKIYERARRGTAKQDAAAGAALLDYIAQLPTVQARGPAALRGVQVRHVAIRMERGRIETATEMVAQHP